MGSYKADLFCGVSQDSTSVLGEGSRAWGQIVEKNKGVPTWGCANEWLLKSCASGIPPVFLWFHSARKP